MRATAIACALVALLTACGEETASTPLDTAPSSTGATTSAPPPTDPAPTTSTADPTTTASTPTSTIPTSVPEPTEPDRSDTTMPEPTEPPETTDPAVVVSEPVRTAITDLRDRLGDPDADVTVVSVDEVTWSDGSIGCPRPDMSYTQALVNGTRIVLEVDGTAYHYHSKGTDDPFYCADPIPPAAGGGTGYGDV